MKCVGAAIVALAIAFGVSAFAQEKSAPAFTIPPKGQRANITGKVTKIDAEKKMVTITVTVEGKTTETVLDCTEARVFKPAPPRAGGEAAPAEKDTKRGGPRVPAKFEDLKVGMQVRAMYDSSNNQARGITILPEGAAAGSPASTIPAPAAPAGPEK